MQNVETLLQPLLLIPGAPPPISPQELQRLRSQAWAEVAAIEASDPRYYRALADQVQHNAHMGCGDEPAPPTNPRRSDSRR